jgi:hypothetical protein
LSAGGPCGSPGRAGDGDGAGRECGAALRAGRGGLCAGAERGFSGRGVFSHRSGAGDAAGILGQLYPGIGAFAGQGFQASKGVQGGDPGQAAHGRAVVLGDDHGLYLLKEIL